MGSPFQNTNLEVYSSKKVSTPIKEMRKKSLMFYLMCQTLWTPHRRESLPDGRGRSEVDSGEARDGGRKG